MSELPPLASLPDLRPRDYEALLRSQRVFGTRSALQYLDHLRRISPLKAWCVYVDNNGAKYFTHFVKAEKPVKNPRSITGCQKYIARNETSAAFLF